MDAQTVTRLLRELVDAPGMELTLDTGFGATATLPAAGVELRAAGDGTLSLRSGVARLSLDLGAVSGAALVSEEGPDGGRTRAFHLTNRSGDDLLRAAFGAESGGGAAGGGAVTPEREPFWAGFAERAAGTPGVRAVSVTRRGPAGDVAEGVLLRCFAELRQSGRIVFLLMGPTASAEVFPNVPLLDPHLSGDGWLYAGEPHRRDVHFHVQVAHTARLRFQEERRDAPPQAAGGMGPPAVNYTVRFLDGAGRTQLYGSVAGSYTNPEGEVVRPSDEEREAFFGALCERYAGEAGVERATITPLRTPAGAAR
jgi:hypothetical protein